MSNVNVTISREMIEDIIDCMIVASASGDETTPVGWLNDSIEQLKGILEDAS